MPASFENPSFEDAGAEPGLALDWTYATQSSYHEFATFGHGSTLIIVDDAPAIEPPDGVTITVDPDGTISLLSAADSIVAYEEFEFGWKSNELYLEALPTTFVATALISGTKPREDFEAGWGLDE